jgi:2-oxoisovalerate dehydrogenase E1 component
MARSTRARATGAAAATLRGRVLAFVAERFPFAVDAVSKWIEETSGFDGSTTEKKIETLRARCRKQWASRVDAALPDGLGETTPGVAAADRMLAARRELLDAVDGCLRREAIRASFSVEERLELLRGMVLTRATDNQLKSMFLSGEVRWAERGFQGKRYRSMGQEAIYGAALRLHRGAAYRGDDGWGGDVVAPLIRDLGAAIAMRPEPGTVRMVLNAQAGKAGPPMEGKDFHIGDLEWGILPAAAPLSISTLTATGMAVAFARAAEPRVAVSFIGEGGASLGEWHEAINLAGAMRLPMIFCVQNNQTALSTPVREQSAVRMFADRAAGYGLPGVTVDGTDPEEIAATFAWAAEHARGGSGPVLIETVAMRMCGHAHHDDMLYLGHEPRISWDYPELTEKGYADRKAWAFWAERDPIARYAARLREDGVLDEDGLERMKAEAEELVLAEKDAILAAPWPDPAIAGQNVFADDPSRVHVEWLEKRATDGRVAPADLPDLEPTTFTPDGRTFLDGVMLGVRDVLRSDPRVFLYGEDVGGNYGNAFLLLRPLLEEFAGRIVNSPISEAGIIGVCVGAALAGQRPIGEIQFNDFVATGFNQLVNNAAKIRYRWGGSAPLVLRLPWGGLRNAGPYHSQNTEPWFYRTPGLKIVTPSTPADARALMAAAVADPDPVLFYEHIGLYRDPRIKQALGEDAPPPLALGRAALRRAGSDLALVSYGAYVHHCLAVAGRLAEDGIEAAVLDLRSLAPLDHDALLRVARHCGKVLVAHEDSRTGGIGESLAAIIQERVFEDLDAPVRVVAALDTPVPYAPSLENEFLPGTDRLERAARSLAAY